jgi:hypothetical protein
VARAVASHIEGFFSLPAGLAAGSAAYLVTVLGVGGLNDVDRRRVRELRQSLRERGAVPDPIEPVETAPIHSSPRPEAAVSPVTGEHPR